MQSQVSLVFWVLILNTAESEIIYFQPIAWMPLNILTCRQARGQPAARLPSPPSPPASLQDSWNPAACSASAACWNTNMSTSCYGIAQHVLDLQTLKYSHQSLCPTCKYMHIFVVNLFFNVLASKFSVSCFCQTEPICSFFIEQSPVPDRSHPITDICTCTNQYRMFGSQLASQGLTWNMAMGQFSTCSSAVSQSPWGRQAKTINIDRCCFYGLEYTIV